MRFYLDGVLLNSTNWNILLHDTELRTPPARGENVVVFNKSGRIWRKKRYDELRFVLAFYAVGTTERDGETTRSEAGLLMLLDELKRLFSQENAHELTIETGTIKRRIGVEVRDSIAFRALDPALYRFAVELVAPYPFWIGDNRSFSATLTSATTVLTVGNNGTYRAENALITVTGETNGISLSIGPYSLLYPQLIERNKTLTIDVKHYEALYDGNDVSALVQHYGDALWLPIPTGYNELVITAAPVMPFWPQLTLSFDEHFL